MGQVFLPSTGMFFLFLFLIILFGLGGGWGTTNEGTIGPHGNLVAMSLGVNFRLVIKNEFLRVWFSFNEPTLSLTSTT